MTEKRFNRVYEMRYGQIGITDELHDSGDKEFPKNLTTEETVDLLNEQHETIQSLISDSEKYRKLSIQFDNRNKELVSENALLEKENEQLKKELHKVYNDDYYLKQFIMAIVTIFSSGNNGLSKCRYELIVDACEMNKTSLKEFFK